MASSVPHSATVPPPLHSPHSPYSKTRPSAFGSSFEDYDDVCRSRPASQQQQLRLRAEVDHADADAPSFARRSCHSSQPSTPSAESHPSAFTRGVKSNTASPALDTPPSLGKSKDARLACRQHIENAYALAAEGSGDSGRPQKKELRIEECVANVCTMNRAAFSPASALSATTKSMDTACTGGRDSSIFSFASSVPDAFVTSLPMRSNSSNTTNMNATPMCGRRPPPVAVTSPQQSDDANLSLSMAIPVPPTGGIATLVEHSSSERSLNNAAAADEGEASVSHLSKYKRRLQGLGRPAFDLKAVEDAQCSFLEEEEVCNAAQCFPLSEITPLLCVGTWKDAANPALLRRLGIKYVLNVARELDPAAEANVIAHNKDLIYESIPMQDCHSQDVGAHLQQAFSFIERARAAHARVLVHCRRGISRSPAIVVGYLMASEHRSYEDALRFVTSRRGCVSLNLAFQERLSEFVPSGEYYHGPPSPSASAAASAPAQSPSSTTTGTTTTVAGVLPSLAVVSARSEHSGCGGGSFRHQPQPRKGEEATLPQSFRTFSASSSNASSRASSAMRQNVSLTGVPSTTPNFTRAPHRPRLAMHRQKRSNGGASVTATPTSVAPTTASDASALSAVATARPDKTSWLEEEEEGEAELTPPAAMGKRSGTSFFTEPMWSERRTPLHATPALAKRPTLAGNGSGGGGGARTLADPRGRRSFSCPDGEDEDEADHNSSNKHRTNTSHLNEEEEEEEVEEPGSPFGVGNRRAFAQFNFSPPSSSSNNVSPASKKNARSFSEEAAENSATLPHQSSQTQRGSGSDASRRRAKKNLWADEEESDVDKDEDDDDDEDTGSEVRCPKPPHRGAPQSSAFDDLADDEGGDDDDDGGVEDRAMCGRGDIHKPRLSVPLGRLSLLTKATAPAGASGSSNNMRVSTGARSSASAPVRVAMPTATTTTTNTTAAAAPPFGGKGRASPQAELTGHAEDSGSSVSHGNTTGTTPYVTQGSLNDETNLTATRVVSHTSSLSG